MRRPPLRTRPPRHIMKKPTGHLWFREDEQLLQSGVFRYANPSEPHAILAERRRLSVDEFLATVSEMYGGTQPNNEFETRRRTT